MKEIKDLNKWKDVFMNWKTQHIYIYQLPPNWYTDLIHLKIPARLFVCIN